MKMEVVDAVLKIVVPPEWNDENSKHGSNLCQESQVGSFNLIIDEGQTSVIDTVKKKAVFGKT